MSHPDTAALPANVPFTVAPPPWVTRCDIYWLLFRTRAGSLPADAYSPLEAASPPFSDASQAGAFKGGLGLVIIIRYSETPVGSYNEMIYMPGSFEVPRQGAKNAARVTRIYVDQKDTTYNGRLSWNLPKHVVRFNFTKLSGPDRTTVQVFPPDPAVTTPFFSATIQPFRWAPAFPFTSKALVAQPPVPASTQEGEEEVCGTDKWVRLSMSFACKKAKLGRVAVEQPRREGEDAKLAAWWPQVKPWKVGLYLENAQFDLGVGEFFE